MGYEMIIGLVATAALGFIALKLPKVIEVVQEIAQAVSALAEAVADNQITQDEVTKLKKEFGDVWNAIKGAKSDG